MTLTAAVVRPVDDLGRIVIPIEVRRRLGIGHGTKLAVSVGDDGSIVLRPAEGTQVERMARVLWDVLNAIDRHLAGHDVDWRDLRRAVQSVLDEGTV